MNELKRDRVPVLPPEGSMLGQGGAVRPADPLLVPAPPEPGVAELARWITQCGGGFVGAQDMRRLLTRYAPDLRSAWPTFEASWDDLPRDGYMGDGGTYRSRRYATYSIDADATIRSEPHQAHYQAREYNTLNGGIARHFEAISSAAANGPGMSAVLRLGAELCGALQPRQRWHVEAHQFRIQALVGAVGRPTPEGVHRDGVDIVLVLLLRRVNVRSGTTSIHGPDRRLLGSFTLAEAFDAALLDDRRCYHGVTPIVQINADLPAFRDVLVVTFRRLDSA